MLKKRKFIWVSFLLLVLATGLAWLRQPAGWRSLGRLRGRDVPAAAAVVGPLFNAVGFVSYSTGARPEDIVLADFNGDAVLDLAVCNSYHLIEAQKGDVSVLLGRAGSGSLSTQGSRGAGPGGGDGSFGVESRLDPLGIRSEGLATADLNGDGNLDLAVGSCCCESEEKALAILLGDGKGGFAAGQELTFDAGPRDVAAADCNGDGVVDLVTCEMAADTVTFLRGGGDGTFQVTSPGFGVGEGPEVVALGALNSDADVDLVTANAEGDSLTVLLGHGDGTFEVLPAVSVGARPRCVIAVDLDGDGLDDAVAANFRSSSVSVLENAGGGRLVLLHELRGYGLLGAAYLSVADINSNGLSDLIVSFHRSGHVAIFPGEGGFAFAVPQVIAVGVSSLANLAADLNGDSHLDLVVGNPRRDRLQVYLGLPPAAPPEGL